MKRLFLIIVAGLLLVGLLEGASLLWAQGEKAIKPGPKDKCPVCGMFVAKYPDFVAVLAFKDGTHAFFDGVKDMMKYYFNLQKYNPSKKLDDIAHIDVTDYYSLVLIDAFKAFYVSGSDMYGPMGKELIPFEKEGDAKEFLKDHKGNAVLRFQDISKDVVKRLD
jgi:copper chaperone NosL